MTPEQAQILGRVEQKITDMCITNTKEHEEIKDKFEAIQASKETREIICDKKFENRLTNKIFFWVMTGVFAGLFFLFGMMTNIDHKLNMQINDTKDVYYQITGKTYTPTDKKQ